MKSLWNLDFDATIMLTGLPYSYIATASVY